MDIATFKTADEFAAFNALAREHVGDLTLRVHVGGVTLTPRSRTDWYWVDTNEQISFELSWSSFNQPDNHNGSQSCLSLYTPNFTFDDIDCYHNHEEKFICQTVGRNQYSDRQSP